MNPIILPFLMAFAALLPSFKQAAAPQSAPTDRPGLLVLRGHVVCFDASGKRLDALLGCNGPNARYALSDNDGKLHYFSPMDASTAMFTDMRVRQREFDWDIRPRIENLESPSSQPDSCCACTSPSTAI